MLEVPQLTPKEMEEINELKQLVGWTHVIEPIKVGIELKQSALLNFDFERDDDAHIKPKSIIEFEKIQQELILLKEFFSFLQDGGIIHEVVDLEVFETPKQQPEK